MYLREKVRLFMVVLIAAFMLRGMPLVTAAISDGPVVLTYAIISLGIGVAMIVGHKRLDRRPASRGRHPAWLVDFPERPAATSAAGRNPLLGYWTNVLWRPFLSLSRALARGRCLPDLGGLRSAAARSVTRVGGECSFAFPRRFEDRKQDRTLEGV
jgi:hypothetical protein